MSEARVETTSDPYESFRELLHDWSRRFETSTCPLEMVQQAINELDEACPFIDKKCSFAGLAVYPEISEADTPGKAIVEEQYNPISGQGVSEGVDVFAVTEGGRPQIWFRFKIKENIDMQFKTMVDCRQWYCFVDAQQCSVQPQEELDALYEYDRDSYAQVSPLDVLNSRSEELRRRLLSTAFRRLSRAKQRKNIENFVERTERETAIRDWKVCMDPEYGYVVSVTEDELGYTPIGLHKLTLSGICLAIDMLGREVLDERGIRCNADIVSKYNGLYLAVALDKDSDLPPHDAIRPGSVIHVPISGQKFDAYFLPRTRAEEAS